MYHVASVLLCIDEYVKFTNHTHPTWIFQITWLSLLKNVLYCSSVLLCTAYCVLLGSVVFVSVVSALAEEKPRRQLRCPFEWRTQAHRQTHGGSREEL